MCAAAGSAVHSVRVEAEYDWPSDRIFSVAREFDVVGSHNRFALVRLWHAHKVVDGIRSIMSTVNAFLPEEGPVWQCLVCAAVASVQQRLQWSSGHMQDHGVLAEPSVFESVVYAGTWLPYPMKPFELVLSVRWVDLVQARTSDPACTNHFKHLPCHMLLPKRMPQLQGHCQGLGSSLALRAAVLSRPE
jgi:hypothetical protein